MTMQPNIPFETLVELVEQLPIEQQQILLHRIRDRMQQNGLSPEEKMALLRSIQLDAKVIQEPSIRREDWYDNDGR